MPISTVLFDHDGTLVDSEAIHFELWSQLLNKYNIEVPQVVFETQFVGLPSAAISEKIVQRYECPLSAEALFLEKNNLVKHYLSNKGFPLIPGALDVIQSLKAAGFTLGVVTGAPQVNVESTLEYYNLAQYFDTVVCGYDVDNNKPAADPYLLAVAQLGVKVSECVAIEDSETGLHSAYNAGIRCLTVESSMTPQHDLSLGIKHCADLSEVEAWIKQHSDR